MSTITYGDRNIQISSTNQMSLPNQSCVIAYQASTAANATGNNTSYTLGTTVDLTEITDQNSDFVPTTGVFTAPITGRYIVIVGITLDNLDAAMTNGRFELITSNREWYAPFGNPANLRDSADQCCFVYSAIPDMDAADTFTARIRVSGSGLTAGIYGVATNPYTYVCCNLIC